MSEHKYNEAWKKGFDSGVEAQKKSCVFDCGKDFDEYETGYEKGRAEGESIGITRVLDILDEIDKQILEKVKDKLYEQDYTELKEKK